MSLGAYLFRFMCSRSDRKRDAGLTAPAGIERTGHIVYGKDTKWQSLELYRP